MGNLSNEIRDRNNQIEFLRNEVVARLEVINYSIFRIKICSANTADSIRALKCELDKVNDIKSKINRLDLKMEELDLSQQDSIKTLKDEMPRIILDLENVTRERGDKKFAEFLERLEELRDELKGSSMEKTLDVAAKRATILGTVILFL